MLQEREWQLFFPNPLKIFSRLVILLSGFCRFPHSFTLINFFKQTLINPISRFVYIITSVVCLESQEAIKDIIDCLLILDSHLSTSRGSRESLDGPLSSGGDDIGLSIIDISSLHNLIGWLLRKRSSRRSGHFLSPEKRRIDQKQAAG